MVLIFYIYSDDVFIFKTLCFLCVKEAGFFTFSEIIVRLGKMVNELALGLVNTLTNASEKGDNNQVAFVYFSVKSQYKKHTRMEW